MSTSFSSVHGQLVTLTGGGYTAVIAQVGANLNRLVAPDGRQLLLPVADDELRPSSRGAVLAPWPNRIAGGAYTWEGKAHQLPLTEPALGNASHGLVNWAPWHLGEVEEVDGGVQLACTLRLYPQKGYPFTLDLELVYRLTGDGLQVVLTARNIGEVTAPYAAGFHPYLVAGGATGSGGAADRWSLELPATSYLETNESMIPVAEHPVAASPLDFTAERPLAGVDLDHGFGQLTGSTVTLRGADGGVRLTLGQGVNWVQVYTDGAARRGVAVEPMNAPANAFVTGQDVARLAPGESHVLSWELAAF